MLGGSFTSKRGVKRKELFKDSRVQLLLGKFLCGELNQVFPVLDKELGYRYPAVEALVDDPKETEPFLRSLQDNGLMTSEICSILVCCAKCGSFTIDRIKPLVEVDEKRKKRGKGRKPQTLAFEEEPLKEASPWRCQSCGALIKEGEATYHPVFYYRFSDEGIAQITNRLVVKPLIDFLRDRGYTTESPGGLLGESNVEHSFDIIAYSRGRDEGVLAMDFVVSDVPIGESKVVSMFAKVYDTTPLKSILVAFPGVTQNARRLAEQYKIDLVESSNVKTIWKELRKIIPTVDEFGFEPLDVMTLLSLPDHLRKTAMVTSELGKATADEIAVSTNRARAVESGYLNQLVRMGYLKKERSGRKVLFSVIS